MALKVAEGTSWTEYTPKIWDGSNWVFAQTGKVWNGSSWEQFFPVFPILYNGGTIQGALTTVDDAGTTGFGNRIGYTEITGWFNNNGTAPSPTTLTTGKTLQTWCNQVHYQWIGGTSYAVDSQIGVIEISGFGATNPGSDYIKRAKLGSTTILTPSNYLFGGGVARWEFTGTLFTIGQTGTYTGYIYG